MPSVGKRIERTTPEMGAARARPWGRDVGLGEETDELDLLQRRLESAVGGRRASIWRRRASRVGLRASVAGRWWEVSSAFIPASPAPRIGFRTARARLELPHGARIHLPRCFPALPFPPGRWLAERPRSRASAAPFSASARRLGAAYGPKRSGSLPRSASAHLSSRVIPLFGTLVHTPLGMSSTVPLCLICDRMACSPPALYFFCVCNQIYIQIIVFGQNNT